MKTEEPDSSMAWVKDRSVIARYMSVYPVMIRISHVASRANRAIGPSMAMMRSRRS